MRIQEFPGLYQARRRTIYQKAVDSLLTKRVACNDSYLSTFLKAEKINFTAKPDPAPRIIQPRLPRYNVMVGRYLKPLEHKIYKALQQLSGDVVVSKGLTIDEIGQCIYRKWSRI